MASSKGLADVWANFGFEKLGGFHVRPSWNKDRKSDGNIV